MNNRTKSQISMFVLAVALLLVAGCDRDGGEELSPNQYDSGYMAVGYGGEPEQTSGQVLFELRIGTPGSAVGFRIRQSGAAATGRPTDVLSFEFGNLDARHGGPLAFDVVTASHGTAN